MFTLQILDGGQSFLHSLDATPVRVGSADAAELRLGEQGVLPQHARLEPRDGGVRLVALGPVRVNGKPVETASLQLGDRIEIGRAVLVVGQAITRKARPEDVLADTAVRRGARSGSTRRQQGKATWVALAAAGALLAAIVYVFATGDDTTAIRSELAIVARLRDGGDLEQAAAAIGRLREEWRGAADGRLRQLDAEQQRLDAIHAEIERLRAQVLDPGVDRTYAEWILELKRVESDGAPNAQIAARRMRSTLRATYDQRPQPERVAPDPDLEAPQPEPQPVARTLAPQPVTPRPVPPEPVSPEPTPVTVVPEPVAPPPDAAPAVVQGEATPDAAAFGVEAQRLAAQGLFAQAMAVLQDARGAAADAQQAAALQQQLDAVRADALAQLTALVAEADRRIAAGQAADAMALLAAARFQFPASDEFAALPQALARADVALTGRRPDEEDEDEPTLAGAPPGVLSSPTLDLQRSMHAVARAEDDGAFATAARLLREVAAEVRAQDADFAERLEARAEAADLRAAWHEHVVAALRDGGPQKATTRDGRAVTLQGAADEALTVTFGDDLGKLAWTEVSSFGLSLLVERTAPAGRAALGAASLFYAAGDAERAEALLARVLPSDASLKPLVDGVLARGRGEPVDERGYTLGRGGFVSVRAAELQKDVQKFAARLDSALKGGDSAAGDALVTEMMQGGADTLQVLTLALQQEFDRQFARVEAHPVRKQVEKLEAARVALDAARDAARALIYDEVRYFYPYKPPAVSSDRFAEYNRVQAEVDELVAALRTVWKEDRLRVRVPAALRTDLERLDWTARVLTRLGPFDGARLDALAWAYALPGGDAVGVRDYCRTVAERAEREQWRLVEAYNAIVVKTLPSPVREQLAITNDYRAMFGHRPLAIVPVICDAAQGHATEMTRLGYFSHFSPVPERRTPYDRMQLAGYPAGVSENIALCDSAAVAHASWCRSSGHHRNLLDPGHREIGIGADGRHWVQNFGSGQAHQKEPAWGTVTAAAR